MRAWVGCDFDGKLSVVAFRDELLLYARANLGDAGARHVQVARSTDEGRSWSAFELLQIDGVNGTRMATNIYYFQVSPISVSLSVSSSSLVGRPRSAWRSARRRPGSRK